jgi:cysteine sulfinate desulfinase/cysteine desulfurase-like protein
MGLSADEAHCTVRFSLGVHTSEEDVDYALDRIREILQDTLSAIRFVPCR